MNRNTMIAVGVGVLLLLLGVGGFFALSASKKSSSTQNQLANTDTNPTQAQMEKMSLKTLMGMNGNQTCTFSDTTTGNSGTVYISGGKMRGDFTSSYNGTTMTSHVLSDTENIYMWTDAEKTGFKTAVSSVENIQESAMKQVDLNTAVDYSCSGWSTDATKFSVPSDKTFTDYSAMMKEVTDKMQKVSGTPQIPNNSAAACAACENLTGDAKTACKTALSCN